MAMNFDMVHTPTRKNVQKAHENMQKNVTDIADTYTIPEDIKSQIPDYFYEAFGGEIVSTSGMHDTLQYNEYIDCAPIEMDTGTHAFSAAFMAACEKLDMMWLYRYRKSLEWYDVEHFDAEIAKETFERFNDPIIPSAYYRYITNKIKESEAQK